jgi:hypothetical protein
MNYITEIIGNNVELEVKEKPLLCHKHKIMQTATGYGNKLASSRMIKVDNRWHRIYARCFSNAGTAYIIKQGKEYIIPDYLI